MQNNQIVPTRESIKAAYGVSIPSNLKGRPQPLFDRVKLKKTTDLAGVVKFFSNGLGQNGAGEYDTNHVGAGGQLAANKFFLARSIGFSIQSDALPSVAGLDAIDDAHIIGSTGIVKVKYAEKEMLAVGPIGACPARFGLDGLAAVSTKSDANTQASSVGAWRGNPMVVDFLLTPGMTFSVEALLETAAQLKQDTWLYCYINGYLFDNR